MNKLKNTVIFIAGTTIGFTTGVVVVVSTAMKSKTLRKGIIDAISDKVSVWVYDSCPPRRNVSYKSYYEAYRKTNVRYRYNDILFDTRKEGEIVIDQLKTLADNYNFVSVADLYDLVSLSSTYTDNRIGWKSVDEMRLVRMRVGYRLDVPKAIPCM